MFRPGPIVGISTAEGGDILTFDNKGKTKLRITIAALLAALMILCIVVTAQSQSGPAVTVTIIADGQEWEYVSTQATVGGILKEAGVSFGKLDRCSHKMDVKPTPSMTIRITRVTTKTVVQTKPIAFKTTYRYDARHRGEDSVIQTGEAGEKEIKLLVYYKDGAQSSCRVVDTRITRQPKDQIVVTSQGASLASRGGARVRTLRMMATAYEPGPRSCGRYATGRTATGMRAGRGVAAVDPRVIPLGTKLYVEGYGYCVAADTGGAIKGNKIDLCYDTYGEAIRFGRRYVTVHILK